MIIVKKVADLEELLKPNRLEDRRVGFIPTMGALHAGHLELVNTSAALHDLTVCSIFVNPTQFNDPNDFKKYPKTIDNDIRLLQKSGADLLFFPEAEEVYPDGWASLEHYDLGYLETILEGRFRPGHFQGVCQVVSRLLNFVRPDRLYMGQKDYQQCMVIRRLLELKKLTTEFIACPTVREADGLAMSSRNLRLSPAERDIAPFINQTLAWAVQAVKTTSPEMVKTQGLATLREYGFRPDYIEIASADDLKPLEKYEPSRRAIVLAAAYLGEVRLIDNLLVN